jgi:hypothetical protein
MNDSGNLQIAEYGKATRFGSKNCPRAAQSKANKPWTFRRAARLLGGTHLPVGRKITLWDVLKPFCGGHGRRHPIMAELLVAETFFQAINGSSAAQKLVLLWVDGPAPTADEVKAEEEKYDC